MSITFESEIGLLKKDCVKKFNDTTQFSNRLIAVAMVICAIWAAIATQDPLLGVAIFIVGDFVAKQIFAAFRKRTFLDLSEALGKPEFRQQLQDGPTPLNLENVLTIYQQYLTQADAPA